MAFYKVLAALDEKLMDPLSGAMGLDLLAEQLLYFRDRVAAEEFAIAALERLRPRMALDDRGVILVPTVAIERGYFEAPDPAFSHAGEDGYWHEEEVLSSDSIEPSPAMVAEAKRRADRRAGL